MQITWTNCAEQMPPDDGDFGLILRDSVGTSRTTGSYVHYDYGVVIDLDAEWTEFTKEKWEELNDIHTSMETKP